MSSLAQLSGSSGGPSAHLADSNHGGSASSSPHTQRASAASVSSAPASRVISPHSDDDSRPPRKKQKTALSCIECKRRKIKCSRTLPCEHCIKRGTECVWDDGNTKNAPARPTFARDEDLLSLAARTVALERFLRTLPAELRVGAPEIGWDPAEDGLPSRAAEDAKALALDEGPDLSDTEDAALELETQMFSGRPKQATDPSRFGGVSLNDRRAIYARMTHPSKLSSSQPQSRTSNIHDEVTTMGTSIVAVPCNGQVGAHAALLYGIGFAATIDEVRHAKREAIRAIIADTPSEAFSHWMVSRYFTEGHWMHHCVQKHTFLAEHARFWEMRAQGRTDEVDPLWLAIWCMVLALAVDRHRAVKPHVRTGDPAPEEMNSVDPDKLCWLAQKLMVVGDWQSKPQVRAIQTTLLFGMWSLHASSGTQPGAFPVYFAGAIKNAHLLGLHSLGEESHKMPPVEDPAWPAGANSIKREGAIHIWTQLLFFDWLSTTPTFATYLIDKRGSTTGPPANVNEDELSQTSYEIEAKPREVLTDSCFTYVKLRLAQAIRLTYERLISPETGFSYEAVLELDRVYATIVEELPLLWQVEHPEAERNDPSLKWHRNIANESVHSRIMRLHRPFLSRGFDPKSKYHRSAEQAVKSARIVINAHHNNLSYPTPYWFLFSHSLGASIVLFCDMFNAIDTDSHAESIEGKKDVLVRAVQIFATWKDIAAPALAAVVQTGSRIISGLFMAVERRRTLQLAGAPAKESFAQVLTRISQECAKRSVNTPLPSPNAPLPTSSSSSEDALSNGTLPQTSNGFLGIPPLPTPSGVGPTIAGISVDPALDEFINMFDTNTLNTSLESSQQPFSNFFAESGFMSGPQGIDSWDFALPTAGAGAAPTAGGVFAAQMGQPSDPNLDWGSFGQAW